MNGLSLPKRLGGSRVPSTVYIPLLVGQCRASVCDLSTLGEKAGFLVAAWAWLFDFRGEGFGQRISHLAIVCPLRSGLRHPGRLSTCFGRADTRDTPMEKCMEISRFHIMLFSWNFYHFGICWHDFWYTELYGNLLEATQTTSWSSWSIRSQAWELKYEGCIVSRRVFM